MNTKDLIEAVKFQVSVKPQDEFMAEVAEGLETLYEENNRQKAEIERLIKANKEFAKKIKGLFNPDIAYDISREIDKLVEEIVGDE